MNHISDGQISALKEHLRKIKFFLHQGLIDEIASGHVEATKWTSIRDAYKWFTEQRYDFPGELDKVLENMFSFIQDELNAFLDFLRYIASEGKTNDLSSPKKVTHLLHNIQSQFRESTIEINSIINELKTDTEDGAYEPGTPIANTSGGVFISYRRQDGSQTARLLRSELQQRGYKTFLDVDDLRSGHFDKALLYQIQAVPNFVLILSSNSLKRCLDERDWLKREVVHALETGRNIVPVMMPNFDFPDPKELPENMRSLSLHHGIPYSHDFFDAMIEKLVGCLQR